MEGESGITAAEMASAAGWGQPGGWGRGRGWGQEQGALAAQPTAAAPWGRGPSSFSGEALASHLECPTSINAESKLREREPRVMRVGAIPTGYKGRNSGKRSPEGLRPGPSGCRVPSASLAHVP